MIPLWMFPMAVVAGNTYVLKVFVFAQPPISPICRTPLFPYLTFNLFLYVLKPSERVPTTAMRLAELATAAGLPPGVLNVIHGGKECVDFLCDAPQVRAISFVGSDAVGKHIYERAGANGKRVQANLGAQNHGVVCEDADADAAVNAITAAAFGAAGQRCMALSRVVLVGKAAPH